MRVSEISNRYAKALLAVTKQKGLHAKAFADLQAVAKIFSADAATKITSPIHLLARIKKQLW